MEKNPATNEECLLQKKITHHFLGEIKKNILARDALEIAGKLDLNQSSRQVSTFPVRNLLYTKMTSPIEEKIA